MIKVLTIEREYGSGGADIARKLSERLGWKLWDQLLTDEIARRLDCGRKAVAEHEERRDSLYYRLFKAFIRGSFEGSVNVQHLKIVDADCIREVTESVVTAAAKEGNSVIVGRGSAYYLQTQPDAFHVFVYARSRDKINRLCAQSMSREEAVQLAETVDRDRAAYIKQYFGADWPTRSYFHLMVNSSIGEDAAVETILNSVAASEKKDASKADDST